MNFWRTKPTGDPIPRYKIGFSSQLEKRLAVLKRLYGQIEVICAVEAIDAFSIEDALHIKFEAKCLDYRETYALNEKDIGFVKQYLAGL